MKAVSVHSVNPLSRDILVLITLICCLTASSVVLSSCSGMGKREGVNPVSEYDPEFDPDPVEGKDFRERLPDTKVEEGMLEQAVEAYDRGFYSEAVKVFTELQESFPASYYGVLAELKAADSQFFKGDPAASLVAYEEFLRVHPKHEAVPYVRFQMGNCYLAQYRGVTHDQVPLRSAIKAYQSLLEEFPDSEFSPLARRHIDHCREKLAEHEAYVAEFYYKQGLKRASAHRYRDLAGNYADSRAAMNALEEIRERFANDEEMLAYIGSRDSFENEEEKARALAPHMPLVTPTTKDTKTTRLEADQLSTEVRGNSPLYGVSAESFHPQKAAEKAPRDEPFLLRTVCENVDPNEVFSITFKEPAKIASVQDSTSTENSEGDTRTVTALIVPGDNPTASGEKSGSASAERECSTQDARVSVQEKSFLPTEENSLERSRIVEMTLVFPADRAYRFFTLDRPYRVVAVVQPQ